MVEKNFKKSGLKAGLVNISMEDMNILRWAGMLCESKSKEEIDKICLEFVEQLKRCTMYGMAIKGIDKAFRLAWEMGGERCPIYSDCKMSEKPKVYVCLDMGELDKNGGEKGLVDSFEEQIGKRLKELNDHTKMNFEYPHAENNGGYLKIVYPFEIYRY